MKILVKTAVPYEVTVENGAIDHCGEIIAQRQKPGAKALIISETNVFPLYGDRVYRSLESAGFHCESYLFPAGEESKQITTVCEMYRALAEHGFTRTDFIVTLGGGVAGDMGGFAAATYLRGISFYQIPTSLLSQVDASVGGKTGVDLPFGKNLVGAFHQPSAVITDPETLRTLPARFFNDGMGEVIKYGCISDPELFHTLEAGTALEELENVLIRCISCKRSLVEEDDHDKGRRMILNFGHTFGHALEKLHDFKNLSHGEAVGIGMVIAAGVGERLGVTEIGTAEQISNLLKQYGLPTEDQYTKEEIVKATLLDKKSDGNTLNLILLSKIGEATIYPTHRDKLLSVM